MNDKVQELIAGMISLEENNGSKVSRNDWLAIKDEN